MSEVGVSLSAGDDGGQRSGSAPAEAGLAQVEEVHIAVDVQLDSSALYVYIFF